MFERGPTCGKEMSVFVFVMLAVIGSAAADGITEVTTDTDPPTHIPVTTPRVPAPAAGPPQVDRFDHSSPHNVIVTNVTYTFIKIKWEPPLDNVSQILNYKIVYSPHYNHTKGEKIRTAPADETTFYIKGLEMGTRYEFYVIANYSNGHLNHSLTKSRTTLGYGYDNPCHCSEWGSNSSICNRKTGQCVCKNKYTMGRRCDECYTGYYHHPHLDCEKCDCPSKFSNGSCYVDERDIPKCNCIKGHGGIQCQTCDRGYYRYRGRCRPCDCNLNENPAADKVCTDNVGRCVSCMYNTAGDHCERCADGYHGEATAQNCTRVVSKSTMMSHQAITVVAVCLTIICIVILAILLILYLKWRRYNNKSFGFWTAQLDDDHENVNFQAIVNQHDPNTIDAELLCNDEVQFGAQEPTLTFKPNKYAHTKR